ncbi:MAG: peptidoglycan-associated lipoprotein Pal [Azonexaceae bacterium]|nr:peptidoglycan-associated lipoprotein Pal [Azonexaceae bacterium]
MSNKITQTLLLSAICLVAACSTTGNAPTTAPMPQPAPDPVRPVAAVAPIGLTAAELAALHDPANPLSKRSIYFDLDSNLIKQDYRSVVEAHGKFLAKKPGVKIVVRGNTDERGSREYNVALGQRRADATKQALSAYGVTDDQIETVSLGSEKPVAEGHDEAAWAKNRRADIAYSGE